MQQEASESVKCSSRVDGSRVTMENSRFVASDVNYSYREGDKEERNEPVPAEDSPRMRVLPLSSTMPRAPYPPRNLYVSPWLVVCMSYLIVIFTCVSVFVPWWRKRQYVQEELATKEYTSSFYFLRTITGVTGEPRIVVKISEYCGPVRMRSWVAFSFLLLSAILGFVFAIVSTTSAMTRESPAVHQKSVWPYRVMHVASGLLFVSLTVTMSFSLNIFQWSFDGCGGANSSYHSQLYETYTGMDLTATAWVMSAVGGLISANGFSIPWDARTIDWGVTLFASFSALTLIFVTVACGVPHWYYKDGQINLVTDVTLWKTSIHVFDWNLTATPTPPKNIPANDLQCTQLASRFIIAQALSIVSSIMYLGSTITGYLLYKNIIFTRVLSIVYSFVGFVVILVQIVLELMIYYTVWCDNKYNYADHYYVLSAGFALVATALCTSLLSCVSITTAYVLTNRYFPSKAPSKTLRQLAIEVYN